MITFPSEAIRDQLSRFRGFDFETSIVKAKVIATEMSSGADGNLDEVWVNAYNFPPNTKSVEVIMEIAYLIGNPEEVDLNSLKKPGPVGIKVACRNAKQIKGETPIFFNGESHRIRWEIETPKVIISADKTSTKFDRRRDKEDEEEEEEEDSDCSARQKREPGESNTSAPKEPATGNSGNASSSKK